MLRALLVFLLLLALGWPLWVLTHAVESTPVPVAVGEVSDDKAIGLQLTFTSLPTSLTVRHLEKDVWTETAPTVEMEHTIQIPYPKEGVDLQWHIVWPENAGWSAVRVRLTDPDGETHEKSLWGKGVVDDVLTFP